MTRSKLVRISKKGQFVIPKEMRKALKLGEGDQVVVSLERNRLILEPPQQFAQNTRGLLRGTWGRNRQEVERYIDGERGSWH